MSDLRVSTISDAAGTGPVTLTKQSAAKAWATAENAGAFSSLDSFNVSSLTDVAVGRITYSFTTSFANTNYSLAGSAAATGLVSIVVYTGTLAVGSVQAACYSASSLEDRAYNALMIHGDLA